MTAAHRAAVLAAAAVLAVAPACSGGGGDKAGGGQDRGPLVLSLESEDDRTLTGAPEFAEAVAQVSGGSMRIEIVYPGRGSEADFERGVVADVRAGKADLGIVDARVWDTLGVRSFQALLAPLLVDSLALERRIVESEHGRRMLAGVASAGVVGIALLPGPLRSPLGFTRPLRDPDDFRGAAIGVRTGDLPRAGIRALGGTARAYIVGDAAGLDGFEMDLKSIDYNGFEGTLTANVVLWPKPFTIVMNRASFAALDPRERSILRAAARRAIAAESADVARNAATARSRRCADGTLSLARASPSQLDEVRAALRPVRAELSRDPNTRALIEEIAAIRARLPAATPPRPRCERVRGAAAAADPLEGRWRMSWTRQDLVDAGLTPRIGRTLPGRVTGVVEFANGRYSERVGGRTVKDGSYSLDGDVMVLVLEKAPTGYVLGHVYRQRWNIYRDRLTFTRAQGSDVDIVLIANPLTRLP